MDSHPPVRYRLDDLWIDVARQQVCRDGGEPLEVTGLSFRLLHYLLQQDTRVVGFDELIERVWAPAVVGEDTVTQRVRLLRQSLGDDGRQPRYLRSVRGQGYQLCSSPQALPADASSPSDAKAAPHQVPRRARAWRWLLPASVALSALAIAAWWWPRDETAPSATTDTPLLQRAAYYAGIGQADNNERAISLFRQRLQEAPDDPRALVGLSRAYSARVCLYNGTGEDAAQARAFAEAVLARNGDDATAHAALGYAMDCRGDVDGALAQYERAVMLDPDADAARASAAYLYARRGRLADALAANLAVRAPAKVRFLPLQIASNLDLLGYVAAAEARYRDSFRLYPDNVFSNLALPAFLFAQGRDGEAQAALDEASSRGTEHAGLHVLAAELALRRGDTDAARHSSRRALVLRPQGSLAQTLAWATGAEPVPDADLLHARARTLLQSLREGGDPIGGVDAAALQLLAGDRPAALSALQAAVESGHRDVGYLRATPLLASLHGDPAFAAVLVGIDRAIAQERERAGAQGLLTPGLIDAAATP
ncbi:MAG: winged helix-turn-helix domain-containing protein [Proteobacteria bacterium]|nr:winged helix-turn-helix domain-containing protein [Pseudomonadota bacterium]